MFSVVCLIMLNAFDIIIITAIAIINHFYLYILLSDYVISDALATDKNVILSIVENLRKQTLEYPQILFQASGLLRAKGPPGMDEENDNKGWTGFITSYFDGALKVLNSSCAILQNGIYLQDDLHFLNTHKTVAFHLTIINCTEPENS
ncbi:hypothetical protein DINM_001265 [Dirofilaria immitis]|nr:hypothetical protein [Dirofilaria immitis]